MKKLYFFTIALFLLGIGTSIAQYSVLLNFKGNASPQGKNPWGSLTLIGKKLYGMTAVGGANNYGCVFSVDTNGANYRDLLDFNNTNGGQPQFSNLLFSKGVLYGMTYTGGASHGGNIFSIDTDGTHYRNMYDFGVTAPNPTASLVLVGIKLYGMTPYGGSFGAGNIFSIDTNATGYTDLYDFSNGEYPYGSLINIGNKLFGGATYAGAHNDGYIFSIDLNGSGFQDIFDFSGTNGQNPLWGGALTFLQKKIYGMACNGGATNHGCIFSLDTNGSGFQDLVDFTGISGPNYGAVPNGSFIVSGSKLFGMTPNYALHGGGNIFSVDTNGTGFNDLYDFYIHGAKPYGALTQAGYMFYGMAQDSGVSAAGDGVVFRFKDTNQILTAANNIKATPFITRLYPNPNNGNFTLSLSNTAEKSAIEIFNMLGEKVYTKALDATNTQLELGNNAAGVYLYRVISETGNLISEGKFIMQK